MTKDRLRLARMERGFHRLSVFASVSTFAYFCLSALIEVIDGRWSNADSLNAFAVIPLATAAVYVFTRGLGWVVSGFLHHEDG